MRYRWKKSTRATQIRSGYVSGLRTGSLPKFSSNVLVQRYIYYKVFLKTLSVFFQRCEPNCGNCPILQCRRILRKLRISGFMRWTASNTSVLLCSHNYTHLWSNVHKDQTAVLLREVAHRQTDTQTDKRELKYNLLGPWRVIKQ